jgi:hypothetical protein
MQRDLEKEYDARCLSAPWRDADFHPVPDIKLDPGFKNFYRWCRENNVPVIIVSS